MQCGKQIRSMEKEYCYDCMHTHHYYEQGLSLWNHKAPVNQSIYQFKYHNQRRYGGTVQSGTREKFSERNPAMEPGCDHTGPAAPGET